MTHALSYSPEADPNVPVQARTYPGTFIVFEGGDGSGKTTQIKLLAEALTEAGHSVLITREPGGTAVGEKLRTLVLEHGNGEIDPHTEALIFAASRAAHAHQKIRPALEAGQVVLCDRYIDSSAAYQGAGRGLGLETVINLSRWATSNLLPDTTILLDVPLAEGRARTGSRGATDRMESGDDAFYRALHSTFRALAEATPARYSVIDGARPIEAVHRDVLAVAKAVIA
ncbi:MULTISPECIES: dTMP kinase [Rothia]|uniref:Thymidylate kinase n=1 Tax=Rothia nasimurium TaxID=85336 RepID=A0A1Y1RQC0_9MICC|nr:MULTISPECIES: dTMP kinase [Rothia]ORC20642.1 dTMP kinase [Rothia nasimurium]